MYLATSLDQISNEPSCATISALLPVSTGIISDQLLSADMCKLKLSGPFQSKFSSGKYSGGENMKSRSHDFYQEEE